MLLVGPKSSRMLSSPLRSNLRRSMRLRRAFFSARSVTLSLTAVSATCSSTTYFGLRPLLRSTGGVSTLLRSATRIWAISHNQRSPLSTISLRYYVHTLSFAISDILVQAVVPKPLDWGDATAISG